MIAKILKDSAVATTGGFFVQMGFFDDKNPKKNKKDQVIPHEVDVIKVSSLDEAVLDQVLKERVGLYLARQTAKTKELKPIPERELKF